MIESIISAGIGIAGSISGANAQNAAMKRQYEYDLKSWQYRKRSMRKDYRHQKRGVNIARRNEEALASWKDQTNLQDWQHALKIQDYEYRSQMRQFQKSEQIYAQQRSFNEMAANAAKEAENRRLQDAVSELNFQWQDTLVQAMEAEGEARASGAAGRSAAKKGQALEASLGRNQAVLAASLLSAEKDVDAAMRKIAADKYGADIAAQAARMLKPERLPSPPKPLTTPRAIFQNPRRPKKFDFGPKPIKGAAASPWGGIADAAAGVIGGIASGAFTGGGGGSKYGTDYDFSYNFGVNGR
jgi:hypothetical protein